MKTTIDQIKAARKKLCDVNCHLDDIRDLAYDGTPDQVYNKVMEIIGMVVGVNKILSGIIDSGDSGIDKEIQRVRQLCRAFLDDTEDFDATP